MQAIRALLVNIFLTRVPWTLVIWGTLVSFGQDAGSVIPFQGQLANQAGQPLSPTSPSTLVFRLYRQAVGGIAIWEESQPNISVNAGRFSVLLGSRTELPAAPNFNTTLYLGITVDDGNPATADVEMRPRQALVPVVSARFASNSDRLAGYDWSPIFGVNSPTNAIPASKLAEGSLPASKIQPLSVGSNQIAVGAIAADRIMPRSITSVQLAPAGITTNELAQAVLDMLVPPGTIVAFGGQTNLVPRGWLICDGGTYLTNDYQRLFGSIRTNWGSGGSSLTFRVPDLRGIFLRGANNQKGGALGDPNAAQRFAAYSSGNAGDQVGSHQHSQTGDHTHGDGNLTARIYVSANNNVWYYSRSTSAWAADNVGANGGDVTWPTGDTTTSGAVVVGRTDPNTASTTEARPVNAAVNYIIKY